MSDKLLSEITEDDIEVARQHLEDLLIMMRDSHMMILPGHYIGRGLVVKTVDGTPSPVIRLHTTEAIRIAIKAMLEAKA